VELEIFPRGNPEEAKKWVRKANDLVDLGKKEEAIEAYKQALNIDADYYTYFEMGRVLEDLGKKEEALFAYDMSVKCHCPDYIRVTCRDRLKKELNK